MGSRRPEGRPPPGGEAALAARRGGEGLTQSPQSPRRFPCLFRAGSAEGQGRARLRPRRKRRTKGGKERGGHGKGSVAERGTDGKRKRRREGGEKSFPHNGNMFRKIFHTMEACFGHFSTQWKRVFHTVEKPAPGRRQGRARLRPRRKRRIKRFPRGVLGGASRPGEPLSRIPHPPGSAGTLRPTFCRFVPPGRAERTPFPPSRPGPGRG